MTLTLPNFCELAEPERLEYSGIRWSRGCCDASSLVGTPLHVSYPLRSARRISSRMMALVPAESVFSSSYHLTPRGFALANPLPRNPRPAPRAALPLALVPTSPPPRLGATELGRDERAGVENLGVAFEDAGGFSTKEVSVVLWGRA